MEQQSHKTKTMILLHAILVIYSLSGIFSKMAAQYEWLSIGFITLYGLMIVILGVYAIGWQQVIKRMPLSVAFANKAVTIIWGMIWGFLFFKESITPKKVIGALFVISGVVLYALSEDEKK